MEGKLPDTFYEASFTLIANQTETQQKKKKKKKKQTKNDYRIICLMNKTTKIFNKILAKQTHSILKEFFTMIK